MGDWNFEKIMADMGVKPVDDADDETKPPRRLQDLEIHTEDEDEQRSLFLAALDDLEIHDKDSLENRPSDSALRKLKRGRKSGLQVEDHIDLHGMRVEEALTALNQFVIKAFTRGRKTLVVVTGKGIHSPDGVSRVRPAVERWILNKGKRFIRAYAEAPRAHGGKGAFVLHLRER
jgi:DNA-nicking Smr family endonuclease